MEHAQDHRPMHHLYPRRGPVRTIVGALTQAADTMATAAADLVDIEMKPPHVGATGDTVASSRGAHAVYAAAWGGLAYTLYAGKVIVTKHHPILGTIAALLSLSNLVTAVFADTVKAPKA